MADKDFNEEPMITVVSDSLDPRVKRQLQSQLQSVMKTVSEVNAELENQEAMASIKKQKDAVSDQSKFDDDTKPSDPPKPIEDNNVDQSKPADKSTTPQPSEENNQPQPPQNENVDSKGDDPFKADDSANGDGVSDNPFDQNAQPPKQTPPQQNQQQAAPQDQQAAKQNQQSNSQPPQQPTPPQNNDNQENGNDAEDPFSDNGVNFESFAGMLGFNYKAEDHSNDQTDDSDLPPIKVVVYIKCGDQGVDNRTNGTVATIEDPQNAVVILDQSDVAEVNAKMEFKALTKQLQTRGVMVFETVDEAIEYLNNVYDEMKDAK